MRMQQLSYGLATNNNFSAGLRFSSRSPSGTYEHSKRNGLLSQRKEINKTGNGTPKTGNRSEHFRYGTTTNGWTARTFWALNGSNPTNGTDSVSMQPLWRGELNK